MEEEKEKGKNKKRKVYAVRRHNRSLCAQKQPETSIELQWIVASMSAAFPFSLVIVINKILSFLLKEWVGQICMLLLSCNHDMSSPSVRYI